ncbi:hypothetical protein HOU00_gp452 [Caulobacter phage CcrPW]|uniref:Uncharacterized protein n=1 Tax=Caulobacter phage CcrPW TaxID=2283271 RepID=A0A385EA38_9CAUD|nr:hypothetical protein HOU00_gp452 [Caulobacter phage CcrPW]AXQ68673.1 hypothetical protein CcrPW_gp134 [Caulobacter phage CcrPW]
MPKAYVHLLEAVHYRRDAFVNGFARLGYIVERGTPAVPLAPDDVVVIWNKTARSAQALRMARKNGAAVLVAENGYFGKDANGHQPYALALDGHNGSGRWYAPDSSRLDRLNVPFEPLRAPGMGKVLIADQRGIGSQKMRSPPKFGVQMLERLTHHQPFRQIELRAHPGRHAAGVSLERDLEDCDALVVWSSNCATLALQKGIPVHYCAPAIASAGAAKPFMPSLRASFTETERREAFSNMAWAQWFLDEIASGEAMRTLLDVYAGKLPSVSPGIDLA